jgi:cell division protein FtsI/penicillin-binding protein 2
MQAQQGLPLQQEMIRQRLPFVVVALLIISAVLIFRVISFQFPQDPRVVREFTALRDANYGGTERIESPRGSIYDRNGNPLAVNTRQYRIGISPNLITAQNRVEISAELAAVLNRDELEIYNLVNSDTDWELIGLVDPEVWHSINDLDLCALCLDVERLHRRFYPQGTLASQVIGFVAGDGEDSRGYNGVEGYYQSQLAGSIRDQEVSNIPFDLPEDTTTLSSGADLVLTIDRDVQFLIESELQRAIAETGATGGTIIVMNPRNGDILGMANFPTFDPNAYYEIEDEQNWQNPAINSVWEPGSVFKVITVAAALDTGAITPDWTYNDQGQFDIGGIRIQNWDRQAHGEVGVTQVLVESLNVGAATIALQMGRENFYAMLDKFGIGKPTRVDMQTEEAGIVRVPNSLEGDWSDSDLGTNSFGQGLSITPLQMLTAINAIANDGLRMQPRVVYQIVDGDNIYESRPTALNRVISEETANLVTNMMVAVVRDGLDDGAQVPGYTVAGKTGTAEISTPIGYEANAWMMSFVGFFPADDPQVSILIKLDRPTSGRWASQVVAPIFSRMATRLAQLLEIPTDDVRLALRSEGVEIGDVSR